MLFTGGLTGAVREGAFDSPLSLLIYAADEEERAMAFTARTPKTRRATRGRPFC